MLVPMLVLYTNIELLPNPDHSYDFLTSSGVPLAQQAETTQQSPDKAYQQIEAESQCVHYTRRANTQPSFANQLL